MSIITLCLILTQEWKYGITLKSNKIIHVSNYQLIRIPANTKIHHHNAISDYSNNISLPGFWGNRLAKENWISFFFFLIWNDWPLILWSWGWWGTRRRRWRTGIWCGCLQWSLSSATDDSQRQIPSHTPHSGKKKTNSTSINCSPSTQNP